MAATMHRGLLALVLSICMFGAADALLTRGKPADAKKPETKAVTAADVGALHKQMETISSRLDTMLNAKDGALAHAKVGPTMKVFLKELQAVLQATGPSSKLAPKEAMLKLQAAKQGLASLMGDLSSRQEQLMKEDNAQRESLLLGVLMTRQKEPMDEQLKVLKSDDFAPLEVSKALLKEHNATSPLYAQVANYLDKHPKRKLAPVQEVHASNPLANVQSMLQKRLDALQHEFDVRERLHKKKAAELAERYKKADKKEQHVVHIMQKREERNFKKWAAVRTHDIKAMTDAVEGVKKGDMKAVGRAQAALEQSLKAMQGQTGGFLYLIQLGHKLMKRDCPYCAAQCVDKCHQAGKPYVQCLTDCADAGK